jgi:hypothetical protein
MTFDRVTTVPGTDATGNRGWEAIAAQPDGRIAAIWLDHREVPPMNHEPGGPHVHGASESTDGAERAQLSKLYFGRVDGTAPPRAVAAGVCYCCKTALAAGADGAVYAAWRHVYPGNIRDVAFTASRDGGQSFAAPVRISEDNWALDGCPENGPSIAIGSAGSIHVVWPTLVSGTRGSEPTLALFHAMSRDARRFTMRQRLTTQGTPYHPQIASGRTDGALLIVWDELRGGRRHVIAARGNGSRDQIAFDRRELADYASYPVVASVERGFVVGWTDTSQPLSRIVLTAMP